MGDGSLEVDGKEREEGAGVVGKGERRVWVNMSERREGGRTKGADGRWREKVEGEGEEEGRRGAGEGRSGIQDSIGGESVRGGGKGWKMEGGW